MGADVDGNELLTAAEFGAMMERDEILDKFNQLDIRPHDTAVLFALCDVNGDGTVCLNEFITGCKKSMGLRPLDYFETALGHRREIASVAQAVEDLGGTVQRLLR